MSLPHYLVFGWKKNRGKGYAVKRGFSDAKGDIVLFMDADGSTPAEEIESNLKYFKQGCDIVIGSRVLQDDQHVVECKKYRNWIGSVFNALVYFILFKNFKDTQCGFKMFRRSKADAIFSRLNIDGFGFDLEVLYLALKMGFTVKEVPVNWSHVDKSKINLLWDSLRMFINIIQIRSWHFAPIHLQEKH